MRNLLITLLILVHCIAVAQQRWVERMIPVRDGESLAADLYIGDSTVRKPTILIQLPYNKNNFRLAISLPQGGGTALPYDSAKYNYVIADWRGFYGSTAAGIGKAGYDRGLDGYDLVEWIAEQTWSDGKIGTWGGSALGQIQFLTAKHRPPHLVCAMPFIIDYKSEYERYFPGGVFMREHYERVESLGLVSTQLLLDHPTYDTYWKLAEVLTDYPDSINVPLFILTGWYDHFPDAVIREYEDLRKRSDPSVRDKHKFVIGPWLHTAVGAADQGVLSYPEAVGIPTDLAFQFFGFYLLGEETAWEGSPPVRYFDLGNRQWYAASLWSDVTTAAEPMRLYLTETGRLKEGLEAAPTSLSYDYDPRDPSPSIGSSIFSDEYNGVPLLHGPQDISQSIEKRGDVAIFSTDALAQDMTVRGAVTVKLFAATDRFDTDFGARLCDVYPDGRSIIIADAIKRLRFRSGYETEELATPGTIYPVEIKLRNLAMTFPKGHKLRIDITSSNFPRFDLNPNTGGALYQPGDTLIAHNTLYFGGFVASYAEIPFAPTAAVTEPGNWSGIRVAPNPCGNQTMLYIGSDEDVSVIYDLYDLLGRSVFTGKAELRAGANAVPLSLAGLPQGAYYFRLAGHKMGVARVVKGFEP